MNDTHITQVPKSYPTLLQRCTDIGFTMPSDIHIGSLLKTLVAAKPNGRFLEIGTGIGLSLAWMIDGMDSNAQLISIDNDPKLIDIAKEFFGQDRRVEIICDDGSSWIKNHQSESFDLIFADAWPGKYSEIDEILGMLHHGGIYIIDDMSVQDNWPEGHHEHVNALISYLEKRADFSMTKMDWSTGIILMTKTN